MKVETNDEKYPVLSKINSPQDLKNVDDLNELCNEIRHKLIDVISKNGGHLASNLGAVELTVALHKVFNNPQDKIIWDVGHQSYTHKMLTGRFDKIDTVRTEGGLSGFTNRDESSYDVFTSGHSSTSISSALGFLQSHKINKTDGRVIAVIGDGALTGGLAYEALNNAGRLKRNFVLVVNDNKMSISKNVGVVAKCLSAGRIKPSYMRAKNKMERVLNKTALGVRIKNWMKYSKYLLKKMIYKSNVFEDMGFTYYGPIDGHNFDDLQNVFEIVKSLNKPVVIHVVTNKGKGYKFAEKNPKKYHGVSSFDVNVGVCDKRSSKSFSAVFGDAICKLAEKNDKICAITAAMAEGTRLVDFASKFKSRFFDVGIAEGHAVTFAGGLAAGGLIPVFAVYSSFLQRAYDQIIHDSALQKLKIVFAIDRAGFVGEDGATHQGLFDVSYFNTIPNVTVFSPSFIDEVEPMLKKCVEECPNVSVIRYPRGSELCSGDGFAYTGKNYDFYGNMSSETLVVTYGRIFANAFCAMSELSQKFGKDVQVLKLNVIKPISEEAVDKSLRFKNIVFFEESMRSGGVAEKFAAMLLEKGYKGKYIIKAVNDEFVAHAPVESQLKKYGLDTKGMIDFINEL